MTRNTTLLSFILVLHLGAAPTVSEARDVRISGMGARQCTQWQSWKEDKNGELRAMALEWAQGFITSHNLYARNGAEPATSVVADASILIPLLDSYCQKNPGNRLVSGMIQIIRSLGGSKVDAAPRKPTLRLPNNNKPTELES